MNKTDRYKIEIFFSPEDKCFIGNVPDIKFCSAHGMTQEEALAEVKTALLLTLEAIERSGIPLPEPSPVVV